jgi:hypothetical protein
VSVVALQINKWQVVKMAFYRKKALQELIPWDPTIAPDLLSISEADLAKGSPKVGDMVAFNPNDASDFWLVEKEFFKNNYEWVCDVSTEAKD